MHFAPTTPLHPKEPHFYHRCGGWPPLDGPLLTARSQVISERLKSWGHSRGLAHFKDILSREVPSNIWGNSVNLETPSGLCCTSPHDLQRGVQPPDSVLSRQPPSVRSPVDRQPGAGAAPPGIPHLPPVETLPASRLMARPASSSSPQLCQHQTEVATPPEVACLSFHSVVTGGRLQGSGQHES